MTARPAPPIDPDVGIPDLIRRLTDDSKRLVRSEVRLAKLETSENIRTGAHGVVLLAVAFGAGVVALVALTFMLVTLVGRLLGNAWAGALVVGAVELIVAYVLVRRGLHAYAAPSYTFAESREALSETVDWAKHARAG